MAQLKNKIGIASNIGKAQQSNVKTGFSKFSNADLYNFASSLPILQGIYPRQRTGSQLIAAGVTEHNGIKVKPNQKYIMSREEVSRQYHLNKLLILSKSPEFGEEMLKAYKKAVQEDYNRGIKVKS